MSCCFMSTEDVDNGGSSGGDVVGPASATDNAVVRFDGTTGKLVQNSAVIVDDTNNVTGMTTLTLPNTGLHLFDTDASHDLIIVPGSNLTADRNLTLTTGDAARTVTISGNTTISQDYSTTGTPQFAKVGIGAAADATRLLLVQGDVTGGVATFDRLNSTTNTALGTINLKVTSSGDMTDGFGGSFQFCIQDTAAVENIIASVHGVRDGADNSGLLRFQTRALGVSTAVGMWDHTGQFSLTPVLQTTGSPTGLLYTGPANTTLTASVEATDINFNLARTVQFSTGALTTQRAYRIQGTTYTAVGASVFTNGITLDVEAPIASTNVTITNNRALRINGAFELSGSIGDAIIFTGASGSVSRIRQNTTSSGIEIVGNNAAADTSVPDIALRTTVTRTAGNLLEVQDNTVARFRVGFWGGVTIQQKARTSGLGTSLTITNNNHTAQTLSTEINNISSSTYTRQWATGALTTQREILWAQPTYSAVGASTFTTAMGMDLQPPTAGTNVTITNLYGLSVGTDVTVGASAAGTTYRAIRTAAHTLTLTGTTQVTSTCGVAGLVINQITVTDASAVTVDAAASIYVADAPVAAGSVTLTNKYSIWADAGLARLDAGVVFAGSGQSTLSNYTTTTFTPTVSLVGGAANVTPVYTINSGRYTQIGNICHVRIDLVGDGGAEGGGTGKYTVSLPLTAANVGDEIDVCVGRGRNGAATYYLMYGSIVPAGTTISLDYFNTLATIANFTGADQSSTTRSVYLEFWYEV